MSWLNGLEHCVREHESMTNWNWLRLGGPAQFFAEPTSVEELSGILVGAQAEGLPVRVLGAGSNILVQDAGVPGVVVHLAAPAFCQIETNAQELIAGGGVLLNHVVATAAREGLAGLESFVGIPGSVGGAVRTNATGHGAAIGQWTDSLTVMNRSGEVAELTREELRFGYRQSNVGDRIVLQAHFALEPGDASAITRQMQKLWILRRAQQPTGEWGHSQVFSDPRGGLASELIEQAGLKGHAIGGARVSDVDANFVEVQPGTGSADVLQLIDAVRDQVSQVLGVELEQQLEVW